VNGDGVVPDSGPLEMPAMMIMHEFDAAGGHGRGLEKVKEVMEAIEGAELLSFSLRSYELVDCEGFGGSRTPERLPAS
jgi:hypothetical protein